MKLSMFMIKIDMFRESSIFSCGVYDCTTAVIHRMKSSDKWIHCPNTKLLRWRSMAWPKLNTNQKLCTVHAPSGTQIVPSATWSWLWRAVHPMLQKVTKVVENTLWVQNPSPTIKPNSCLTWPKRFPQSRQQLLHLPFWMQQKIGMHRSSTKRRIVLQ